MRRMERRCGLVVALPGIEPGKTFRAIYAQPELHWGR